MLYDIFIPSYYFKKVQCNFLFKHLYILSFLSFQNQFAHIMALFEKIVGFKDKTEKDIVVRLNPERCWDDYSTIGEGLRFARRNPVSHFLVESWNYSCVAKLADMKDSENMVNLSNFSLFQF